MRANALRSSGCLPQGRSGGGRDGSGQRLAARRGAPGAARTMQAPCGETHLEAYALQPGAARRAWDSLELPDVEARRTLVHTKLGGGGGRYFGGERVAQQVLPRLYLACPAGWWCGLGWHPGLAGARLRKRGGGSRREGVRRRRSGGWWGGLCLGCTLY